MNITLMTDHEPTPEEAAWLKAAEDKLRAQMAAVQRDCLLYGMCVTVDGKHVPLGEVRLYGGTRGGGMAG